MRTYIIYAPETDCSLRVLACPSHETAVADDELAVYATNSLENFPRISCSRQKVVPLFRKSYHFFAYQLFPSLYQLFPSPYQLFPSLYQLFPMLYQLFPTQGTPSPRMRLCYQFYSPCKKECKEKALGGCSALCLYAHHILISICRLRELISRQPGHHDGPADRKWQQ